MCRAIMWYKSTHQKYVCIWYVYIGKERLNMHHLCFLLLAKQRSGIPQSFAFNRVRAEVIHAISSPGHKISFDIYQVLSSYGGITSSPELWVTVCKMTLSNYSQLRSARGLKKYGSLGKINILVMLSHKDLGLLPSWH